MAHDLSCLLQGPLELLVPGNRSPEPPGRAGGAA